MFWSSCVSNKEMKSFNILVILVLVLTVLVCASGDYTMAKLNQTATLLCTGSCPGLMEWTQPRNKDMPVARCNQTECRPEKGYEMSHEQYLKGNLSLTITAVDYSKRTWYKCRCDGRDVCDVNLRIEPLELTRKMKPGEPLFLELPITENVKVTFNQSGDDGSQRSVLVCTADGRKLQCDSEYKNRASLKSSLTLTEVKESDRGVYTVQDTENEEVIATYTVTGSKPEQPGSGAALVSQPRPRGRRSVSEEKPCPDCKQDRAMPAWGITLIVVQFLVIAVLIVYLVKRKPPLQREPAVNRHTVPQTNGNTTYNTREQKVQILNDSTNTGT
ncbi:uncharacterized protein LOC113528266 isoform X2 [Pangasianodon hypophthalmus]|uniref:uncharacterized protein LOC113528266 isoform X2 n=1 Tax=Pangasianodon hypophthalmus TaxID=310915 RepID=UPI0023071FB8|nr:uncharacterized protein LOC113528266 isoform X2 [Pangasianodon hypophthalmus]